MEGTEVEDSVCSLQPEFAKVFVALNKGAVWFRSAAPRSCGFSSPVPQEPIK